jgi:hypothetical protein
MEEKRNSGCRLLPIASEVASSSRTAKSSRKAMALEFVTGYRK